MKLDDTPTFLFMLAVQNLHLATCALSLHFFLHSNQKQIEQIPSIIACLPCDEVISENFIIHLHMN